MPLWHDHVIIRAELLCLVLGVGSRKKAYIKRTLQPGTVYCRPLIPSVRQVKSNASDAISPHFSTVFAPLAARYSCTCPVVKLLITAYTSAL